MSASLTMSWALRYLKEGWSIIPVEPKGKKPLIDWKPYQQRLSTETELRSWLEKWPEMNIGIVTGFISGLTVLDLDGTDGNEFRLKKNIVSPAVSLTGNGRQVFYKWKDGIKNSVKVIASGVDVRGEGGFVVAPPSIHQSGKMYRWERFVPVRIPDFPTELVSVTYMAKEPKVVVTKSDDWLSEALEEMKNGHVHNTLVSVLGKFRAHNFSVSDTVRLLQPHCFENGAAFRGLEAKVREIWGRYPSGTESERRPLETYRFNESRLVSIKSPTNNDDFEQFQRSNLVTDKPDGLQTGFPTLDRYLEGGLKSERLFTVAARTGTGKTNFAIALAHNLCEQNKKVLFFSTEFRFEKIWSRYRAIMGTPERFRNHAFYVCDSFSPNIGQVEEAIKRIMPDVFIFDHINQMGEERETLGAFMQGANFLQRQYNAQGIMVAQLNRQADWVESGKRVEPRMSMIKGSGTIEQASSRVLLLSETRVTPEFNEVLGVLDKNDSGDRGLIQFGLYKQPYIFKELGG